MSAHDLSLCNPPLDNTRPASGVVFTNVASRSVVVAVSLELLRDPAHPVARAAFRGLHFDTPNREHVVELAGSATSLRTVVLLHAPAMDDQRPRHVTVEAELPGTTITLRVISISCSS